MASFQPFEPAVKSGAAGLTVSAAVTSASQVLTQIVSGGAENTSILLTAINATATPATAYVRMSVESSTAITATNTDTPVYLPASTVAPYVRLFANPSPLGTTNIAVIVTVAPSTAGLTFYFTPGQGGDV